MNIGLLIYGSLDTLSGGYLYDRKMVEYLRRRGDRVEIISLPWRDYARHLGDNLSLGLVSRLTRLPLDVLVQDELNHPSLFWTNRRLRARARYPIVSIVHHLRSSEQRPAWQNSLYRQVERLYLQSLDGFIFNSRATQRSVESVGIDLAARSRVIAYPAGDRLKPAITPYEIERRALEPGPLRLFFLGNVIPRKGLHILLEALQHLDTEHSGDASFDWSLVVAGSLKMDPAYSAAMQRKAGERGLAGKVGFTGPLDETELAKQMQASHLLALPSSYEGFGIAYLEGMGYGLPAIGTTGGGAAEIITPGVDGILIQPGDTATLVSCLSALGSDRQHLLRLSLAARQRFLAHPSWDVSMGSIRSFLQSMVEN